MAKLGTYYGLCPLIDHRSLLGITNDKENGNVIVTLGKNIAVKYKVSDQTQLHSWRTKEKFTSPIIYDKQQEKYVAVFNESYIHCWTGEEELLNKLKKFRFNQQIHTIICCGNRSFILFKNGGLISLQEAIKNRKELKTDDVIDLNFEYIVEVLYTNVDNDIYIGLIVKSNDKHILYWTKFNDSGQEKFYKITLNRANWELNGYTFYVNKSSIKLLTLWNDSRVYSVELKDFDLDLSSSGELFAVIESLICKHYVSMVSLDQNYIAMYGCNCNDEGALLVIYNMQFKVTQLKLSFKLFTNGAKMCCIDENLFVPVGQNLAVVPFHLDVEQLAALVGSRNVMETDPDPDIFVVEKVQLAKWGDDFKLKNDEPQIFKPKVSELFVQGLSENMISETVLNDLMGSKDIKAFIQSIQYFSDIPEKCLVNVLKFILNLESKLFQKSTHSTLKTFPQKVQPQERAELLDLVFTKSYNESILLPHLRSIVTLDEALILLQYIRFLLSDDGHFLPSLDFAQSERKLIEWACIILDANYQKFLLTRDEKINEVLSSLQNFIKDDSKYFENLKYVSCLLNQLKEGTPLRKIIHIGNLNYSIEDLRLY